MARPPSFGAWVRRRRKALDLTQAELAQQIGCARVTIQKIESGERRPSREFAVLLADKLAVAPAERAVFLEAARSALVAEQLDDSAHGAISSQAMQPPSGLTRVGNLPAPTTACIGRDNELAQLKRLLADPICRLISLTGMGGIGKTRLAIEAAATGAALFPDGAWFVGLAPLESDTPLAGVLAETLGLVREPDSDPATQLVLSLRDKHMLLVLDNAEHILSGTIALLSPLLRGAPGLKVIVTSRERLRLQGEWVIELHGLPAPPKEARAAIEQFGAVRLFLERARMGRLDFSLDPIERPYVARICAMLEGVPLAIELAACWTAILPCQAIAEQIARRLDASEVTPRDLPERHRSLRAVFDHSWNLLSAAERSGLSRLSVFRGTFDMTAAAIVADATLSLLLGLLDKSLLRRSGDHGFELHPLVRQYASERLAESADEHERAMACHAAYYAALADFEGAAKDSLPWEPLERAAAAFADIRAAWEWAIGRGATPTIAQMLGGLQAVITVRGWFREGVDLFGRAALMFENLDTSDVVQLTAKLRVRQAICYQGLGMLEQGRLLFQKGLATAQKTSEQAEIARCLEGLGSIAWAQGICQEARPYIEEALNLYEALGNAPAALSMRSSLSMLALDLGEYAEAHRLAQVVLEAAHRSHSRWWQVVATLRLGYVEYTLGRYPAARALIEDALTAVGENERSYAIVHLRCYHGLILAAQGEDAQAEHMLREALALARVYNYPFGTALGLNYLGYVVGLHGAHDEARSLLEEGLAICEALKNRTGIVYALTRLGDVACAVGSEIIARRYLLGALDMAATIEAVPLLLDALTSLAALTAQQGKSEEALRLLASPLVHPASRHVVRERAARLRAEMETQLSPQAASRALAAGQQAGLEQIIAPLLEVRDQIYVMHSV